jgi:hypothetical protein
MSQKAGFAVKIGFDAEADCNRPFPVQNYTVHANFDAFVSPQGDGSADLSYSIPFTPQFHIEAKLDGPPKPAAGGWGSLKTLSKDRYQILYDLPNNQVVLDIFVRKQWCNANISIRLRPREREYSWYMGVMNYCSRIDIKKTSCETN